MTPTQATTPNVAVDLALLKQCRKYLPFVPRGIKNGLDAVVNASVSAFLDYSLDGESQRTVLGNYCEDQLTGWEKATPEDVLSAEQMRDLDAIARESRLPVRTLIRGCLALALGAERRKSAINTAMRIERLDEQKASDKTKGRAARKHEGKESAAGQTERKK